ncbi:MAG TPA: sodium-dependent transporter [Candidatus Polarisedimenticolia bacterium]|nr:sodium-dependent transporter [Candidatus Polarisedimenticolia bacterium]
MAKPQSDPLGLPREAWASRLGLILAMAGNAIGLGNFLRFPVQAARNGGGAFMIPYFVALLLLGIPLMWVEWAIGRHGGSHHGHGSMPGMFQALGKKRWIKYLGVLGLFNPLVILIYYTYIESWTMAYSFFSATGKYFGIATRQEMGRFLNSFQGFGTSPHFPGGIETAYVFMLVTLGLNIYILYRGITAGIERLAKIAMPLLFLFAIALAVRVLTLGAPDANHPDWSVASGVAYLWNPDFSQLTRARAWLAAAGQIFFTLSLGMGSIQCYASYLKKNDDLALTGLTTSVTNEFAEVILGGSIAIPVAVAYFGLAETQNIAAAGSFDLGFQSMPIIFQRLPLGHLFGFLWFGLLFFAGITSSVAMGQPIMAFLQEEFGFSRQRAALALLGAVLVFVQPVIFVRPFLGEMDFWSGTIGLALFGLIEVILFAWVFGMDRAWEEITRGADIRLPRLFYYIIKYVTPLYLMILFGFWTWQDAWPTLLMKGVAAADRPGVLWARALMIFFMAVFLLMIGHAWRRRRARGVA